MARCFGGGLKHGALSMHFTRNIKPNVELIRDALARGEDPIGVTLLENVRSDKPGKRQAHSHSSTRQTTRFPSAQYFIYFFPSKATIDVLIPQRSLAALANQPQPSPSTMSALVQSSLMLS